MDPAQLVIFDMDGLMFDTERLAVAAWVAAGRRFGVPVTTEDVIATIGLDARASEAVLRSRFGADMPYAEMRQYRIAHARARIEADGLPVKPGLYELLDDLEAQDIRRAVATSTRHERAAEYLAMAGVLERFDAIVGGDEVAHSKPEPDIFLAAAAAVGCPPAACVVLEDSESGLRAAARAGMRPILVPDIRRPCPEVAALAECECASLLAVRDYLAAGCASPGGNGRE